MHLGMMQSGDHFFAGLSPLRYTFLSFAESLQTFPNMSPPHGGGEGVIDVSGATQSPCSPDSRSSMEVNGALGEAV